MVQINLSSNKRGGGNGSGSAGSGCLLLFGLIFALSGVLASAFVVIGFFKTLDARSWERVPAVLEKAEVTDDRNAEEPFTLEVAYTYSFEGRDYASTRYGLSEKTDDSYEKLALKAKALLSDRELVARVDPDDPASAVLYAGSLWSGLFILIPMVFVAVGLGIMYLGLRARKKPTNEGSGISEAISSSPTSNRHGGAKAGVIFGGVFLLVGLGLLYPLGIKLVATANAAKNWVETPCEIIWGEVRTHTGDDSTTYSVDIFYSYVFEGEQYKSNRYSYMSGSSSGRASKQKVVDAYRKAKSPVCYVDPSSPHRAILKRELGMQILLPMIPAAFVLAGGLVVGLSLRSLRKSKREEEVALTMPASQAVLGLAGLGPEAGARTLSPGASRITTVVVLLLVTLFWNGLVFGLLFREAWLDEAGGFLLKLFSIPFMLVGVGIAIGFFYTLLALFNPRPYLTLDPGEVSLGEEFSLRWRVKGSARRLRRLRFVLRGYEKATYRRGTDTVTDQASFYAQLLDQQTDRSSMYQGAVTASIPEDLMHSFKASNNEIEWKLEVKGDIPYWPDVSDDYVVNVHPANPRKS